MSGQTCECCLYSTFSTHTPVTSFDYVESLFGCHQLCANVKGCVMYTWVQTTQFCSLYTDFGNLDNTAHAITANVTCNVPISTPVAPVTQDSSGSLLLVVLLITTCTLVLLAVAATLLTLCQCEAKMKKKVLDNPKELSALTRIDWDETFDMKEGDSELDVVDDVPEIPEVVEVKGGYSSQHPPPAHDTPLMK